MQDAFCTAPPPERDANKCGVDVHKVPEAALTSGLCLWRSRQHCVQSQSEASSTPPQRCGGKVRQWDCGLTISHTEIAATNRLGTKTVEVAKRPPEGQQLVGPSIISCYTSLIVSKNGMLSRNTFISTPRERLFVEMAVPT
jgi:hypothetical protein